jgi:hypothetical protein
MPSVGSLEREQIRAVAEKLNSILRERANLFVERPRTKVRGPLRRLLQKHITSSGELF